jgi:nucleoid-associated protein YgaU
MSELTDKYQAVVNAANENGITDLNVSEENNVLHVSGKAPSEEAKQKVWDVYSAIDPEMRAGDMVLNIEVEGGGDEIYTVKPGDSLWRIAEHHYGDGNQYMKIFEANRDKMDSPNSVIHPGDQLKVPKA